MFVKSVGDWGKVEVGCACEGDGSREDKYDSSLGPDIEQAVLDEEVLNGELLNGEVLNGEMINGEVLDEDVLFVLICCPVRCCSAAEREWEWHLSNSTSGVEFA